MAIRGVPLDTSKPLRTRGGRKARIICEDRKGNYPIIALIDGGSFEDSYSYTKDGFYNLDCESDYDLFVDEPAEQQENKIETVEQRKVVQISVVAADDLDTVYALCNDGKIFGICPDGWKELPPIPQD